MPTTDKLSYFFTRIRSLPFILSLFFLIGAFQATAQQTGSRVDQLSDEQVQEFYSRAQASGLSEAQIEQAAMSQGYTLTDIAKMRRRIAEIRTQSGNRRGQTTSDTSRGRTLPGDLSRRYPDSLPPDLRLDTTRRLRVFGASLFENASLSFEPNLRIATPRNYIVGPDDEISIDVSGASSDSFKLRVSPEGTVKVPNLQPIFVSGLTIEQAEQRIIERLRKGGYQGLGVPGSGTSANVALTNIRSIRITLVGEVVRPGTYTISSLGSAFNALYLAGGPNPETGSFRKISIIRGNRVVRNIDLYNFILRADQRDNIRLQDQDVIRVADYETRVELTGQVRRPAIFEMLPGETLKNLLSFAGGFGDDAYRASITLRRNTSRERRIVTIGEEQIATFIPQRGDKYVVGKILERYENRVQVAGAVMRPGDYALEPGLETVRQLITRAEGLSKDAFTNRATIIRERPDRDSENLSFDLGKLMRGEIADIPLLQQDSLTVLSIRDLREEYYITIEGAVNKPDTMKFVSNMSVADLIALAGGFSEGATPNRIEVARRIRQDSAGIRTTTLETFQFALDRNLQISPLDVAPANGVGMAMAPFRLQPFDIVYVRTSPNYEPQRQVYVSGEVLHPGNYAISSREERIVDVIQRAGGLRPSAYLPGAQYRRRGQLIGNDLRHVLNDGKAEENLLLEDGDTLFIPRQSEIVEIQGAVLNAASVSYKAGYKFDDYISEAGGYTDNARIRKGYVVYPNGRKDRTRPFFMRGFLSDNGKPKVQPGSVIIIPFKPLETNRMSPAERIGILSLVTTMTITVLNILLR
ncbi:SLBB domain-containing protein [Spirosoma utsteinense]|uniref:Protein involved in polysaccharide export with SLBB domain n=1 Tax=Spirosoma utsteinense TaxID=2585773 RepID=A0ABR6W0A3_9BACT|nr:SLBB domain-containing protein [Spirosoma utsteinense]MBC3783814.1 protein involved in polysaccharide export with SLBB domain [Spirosoma utsteinense]MBC3790042.1 protein involved in polysaccharide export with SLBB domain [Spirosoma utsteinense]